ncbi:hypothetical protein TN53_32890 [Streptomyces sp. WM6386]|nr:hypothetical protein TN53_32890 [Streptomyces sp. WM6386]
MVTFWQSGMRLPIVASSSWGTWLPGPPPTIRVGAVMSPRRASHLGSGLSTSARMGETAAQSKSVGASGATGEKDGFRGKGGGTSSRTSRSILPGISSAIR